MARFDDYHRTVVGYHGTGLTAALRIVNRIDGFGGAIVFLIGWVEASISGEYGPAEAGFELREDSATAIPEEEEEDGLR